MLDVKASLAGGNCGGGDEEACAWRRAHRRKVSSFIVEAMA